MGGWPIRGVRCRVSRAFRSPLTSLLGGEGCRSCVLLTPPGRSAAARMPYPRSWPRAARPPACAPVSRSVRAVPSFVPVSATPPRGPEGCIRLRAGRLLAVGPFETVAPSGLTSRCRAPSVGASQSGGPRAAACVRLAGHTARRPARGEGGVRWRKGQPGGGRRWWGGHGKSGFIFPILYS